MNKTLKEITEQAGNLIYKAIQKEGIGAGKLTEIIQNACLEYAKSIVPEEENHQGRSLYMDYDYGFNSCRDEILSSLSKEEQLLNQ